MARHDMDNTEFTKIYSVLGVFQDDGWEMIRAAYKKQIKRWHPDRFQDPSHRKIAEEKSKEINHAYQKLSEYYEKFGELPPDHSTTIQEAIQSIPTDAHDPAHSYAPHADSTSPTRQRSFIPVIFVGVLIALGYSIWGPMMNGPSSPDEIDLAGHSGMRVDEGNTLKLDDDRPQDTGSWNEESNRYQKTSTVNVPSGYKNAFESDANSTTSANNTVVLIKRGSTKTEVLAAQGLPQRQTDNAWDYGASRIYFEGGQVSSWQENPLYPLNVVR